MSQHVTITNLNQSFEVKRKLTINGKGIIAHVTMNKVEFDIQSSKIFIKVEIVGIRAQIMS